MLIKPLGMLCLTATASAIDAAIKKKKEKLFGSGNRTTLIISNDDMQNVLKILKSLEDSGILLDGLTEKVKNEVQEQKGGFLSMLLGTLASSLLTDMLLNKKGEGVIRARKGRSRAGYRSKNF